MGRIKIVDKNAINGLSYNEKVRLSSKLAKRINQRMSSKGNIDSSAFHDAKQYLSSNDRTKFYQGTKYKTEQELNTQLSLLININNDITTTHNGQKQIKRQEEQERKKIRRRLIQNEHYDIQELRKLNHEEKVKQVQKMSKKAYQRLSILEKEKRKGNAYKYAKDYLNKTNRSNFYTGKNYKNDKELNRQLYEVAMFLNSKTSTKRGIDEANIKRIKSLRENKNINVKIEDEEQFIQFLESKQFESLKQKYDSGQILEDVDMLFDLGATADEINNEFKEFQQNELMYDEQINAMKQYYENKKQKGELLK